MKIRILSVLRLVFLLFLMGSVFSACNTYKPNISMVEAVTAGNEKAVKYYIKQGELVNQKDEEGLPLIVLAAKHNFVSIIQQLAKAGANINAKSPEG
ncbi:MAG: ankyrin repeat domain-containing protein, partial [Elusimicrobia bacterium]|nr:ankyrin repeat domain-containing protein [Elusimicrobiota bacterium]